MESAARRHGDVFRLRLYGLGDLVVISDPELIKQVFTGDPGVLHAGSVARILSPVVGEHSVLVLDEPEHLPERKLMLPPFHGDRMREYEQVMVDVTRAALTRWPRGRPIALQPLMAQITLDIIIRAVYGIDDAPRQDALRGALRRMLDDGASELAFQVPALRRDIGPYQSWRRLRELVARVDELIFAEISGRRVAGDLEQRADILSLLLLARREDGSALSDEELRDELVTLLTAGHETTATALAWTFELLSRNPDVSSKTVKAVEEEDDRYLDAVVQEALRLRPVIPIVARRLAAPLKIGAYELPKGMVVAPGIYLTHMRPDVYPEPAVFRPERFLEEAPGTYSWLPFGGGVRRCLGASFAQFEMRVVLREVLSRVTLRPADRTAERIGRRSITLAPKRGTRVVVADRSDSQAA